MRQGGSLSRQFVEATKVALNDETGSRHKRARKKNEKRNKSPPPPPLTQAQVDQLLDKARHKGRVPRKKEVGRQKKQRDDDDYREEEEQAPVDDGDEDHALQSFEEDDLAAEEDILEVGKRDDEEDDEVEEENEDEEEEDSGLLPPVEKKRKFKKRKQHGRKKRSMQHVLWLTVDETTRIVKCRLCLHQIKFHLSNCKDHWAEKHRKEWVTLLEANDRGEDLEAVLQTVMETRKQGDLVGFFRNSPALVISTKGAKADISVKVRKQLAVVYHLICCKESFNSLSDPSFQVLKKEWGVQIDETSKIQELIEPMFVTAVRLKEQELMACGAVSTTIDFWTSAAKRKYLAITYHGITPQWQMSHHLLDLVHFPGATFAELIGFCVSERIAQHLPGNTMSVATVSDQGGDVKKARNVEIDEDGEDCMNHRLNLVLNDIFGDSQKSRGYRGLLAVVMVRAVSYIITVIEADRNCKLFLQRLQEWEEYDQVLQFVQKNDTRWEGLLLMLERFARLQDALMSQLDGAEDMRKHLLKDWPAQLTDANDIFQKRFYVRLQGIIDCLKPFSVASRALQDLKRPTASRVPGLLHYIDEKLLEKQLDLETRGIPELAIALQSALTERTSEYLTTVNNCLKAALVDPTQSRFVASFGVDENIITGCWLKILDECVDFYSDAEIPVGIDIRESCATDVRNLRNYLANCSLKKDDDPLEYYRDSKPVSDWCRKALPVVRMLLAIPAGESHCERAFSWAHGFVTRLRTRTSNQVLEMQMVLYDLFKRPNFNWEHFLLKMVELGVLKHN